MSLFLWIEPLFFLAAYVWERFTRENILTVACVVIALSLVRIVWLVFIFIKAWNDFRMNYQGIVANVMAMVNPTCVPTFSHAPTAHQQQYEKEQQEEVDEDLFSEL